MLNRFTQTTVVVSYYDEPPLADMYVGWTRHDITVAKALGNQGSQGNKGARATEVLLVNQPGELPGGGLFKEGKKCRRTES
jgi:hypothetical protein